MLVVAAVRGEAREPAFDLRGGRRLLVQAQVRHGRTLGERDLGREVPEHGRIARGDEVFDDHEPRMRARLDREAGMLDRGLGRARDMDDVERLGDLAAFGDADQDAAGSEGVGQERIAVVSVLARLAQERERCRRLAIDEGPEVHDLEPRRREAVGQRGVEAPVDQHDAPRALDRQQAGVGQGGRARGAGRRRFERVCRDARVIEVFPVLVAPVRQAARTQSPERPLAAAGPGGAARQPAAGGGHALEAERLVHAAAVPSRSQS